MLNFAAKPSAVNFDSLNNIGDDLKENYIHLSIAIEIKILFYCPAGVIVRIPFSPLAEARQRHWTCRTAFGKVR